MRAQEKLHKAFTERKESGYVTSEPQYRHFDRNLPMGRVPHLLMLELETGRVTDLLEGTDYELPRADPCAAHFDISPDGRRIAFAHDTAPRKCGVNPLAIAEIDVRTRRISPLANDKDWSYEGPRYAPDGLQLAWVPGLHAVADRRVPAARQPVLSVRGASGQSVGWKALVVAQLEEVRICEEGFHEARDDYTPGKSYNLADVHCFVPGGSDSDA